VPTATNSQGKAGLRGGLSRYSLLAALIFAGLATLVAVLLSAGGGSHRSRSSAGEARAGGPAAANSPRTTAHAAAVPMHGGDVTAGAAVHAARGARTNLVEVADPEESKSFPAPTSVHHRAATTPAKAGEALVAPGAPSDAEVRHELNQMKAAQRTAQQTQKRALTPVAGGNSVGGNGTIAVPPGVPAVVARVIAGANAITDFPYVFGGGHASFVDNAYDCSGSVSYALAAGGLLSAPETSGALESWGAAGPGRYITVYANAGHTYMYVDGILYDTAGRSGVYASRWQVSPVDNSGYVARHWPGL
jgi:cell wall-associated NlpC family hydrolase